MVRIPLLLFSLGNLCNAAFPGLWVTSWNKRIQSRISNSLNSSVKSATTVESKIDDSLVPIGINNLCNTCYMNSVIQCLYHTVGFRKALLNTSFKESSIGEEFQKLFIALNSKSSSSVKSSVASFAEAMGIDVMYQEDAEEFMLKLFDELDQSIVGNTRKSLSNKLSDWFKLEIEQKIKCVNIEQESRKIQTSLSLSVDCKGMPDIKSSIQEHFETELFVGENQYRSKEHGLQDAEKILRIAKLPKCLIIHLKRFVFDPETMDMNKLGDSLDIPPTIDVSDFIQTELSTDWDDPSTVYDLHCVAIHEGELNRGHYYSYVKIPYGPKQNPVDLASNAVDSAEGYEMVENQQIQHVSWFRLNDHVVSEVDEDLVLDEATGYTRGESGSNVGETNTLFQRLHSSMGKKGGSSSRNAYLLFYSKR